MSKQHEQPQPKDLSTGQRLVTTFRAVAQGITYDARRQHDTEAGAAYTVELSDVQALIEHWPAPQKNIAGQMLEKYGPPNEATPTKLFWYGNGPWKRTVLSSDVVVHHWPTVHTDFLTQYINYRVPAEMIHLISMFDGSVIVDRTRGEVAARCDSESANVLAMNMVHEIVTGKRTVDEAREISTQNTVAYNMGRAAPYAERMLFEIPESGTEDLDRSMIGGPVLEQAAGKIRDVLTRDRKEATDRLTPDRSDQARQSR